MTAPGKAPKPKGAPKSPSAKAPRPKRQMSSVDSWEKVVRDAPWVGGQSSGLNPGSTGAIGRRKNSAKFKARGKKVVRPRIQKHRKQADK
jgi:hypothetical protein